ncbi:hypothetical protein [Allocoleopsis sp.]|uniref:hypothetical protein n=1 Tax=Allocoleopsis sp. TaxID=3088169 RepID=UPI002FD5CEB8
MGEPTVRGQLELLSASLVIDTIHIPITTVRSLKNYALSNSNWTGKMFIAIAFHGKINFAPPTNL